MPPKFGASASKCGACQKSVYAAEKAPTSVNGTDYHKQCMVCVLCRKGLDSTNLNEHESKIYCKACYGKNFGVKLFGYAGGGALGHTE